MPRTTPPEAARSLVIAGQAVSYRLRRSQRRTIGLSIDHRGLRVGAPTRARLDDIEALIRQHGDWVIDRLRQWRERPPPGRTEIEEGSTIPVLGAPLRIRFVELGRRRWQFGPGTLYLQSKPGEDRHRLLEAALREHARQLFDQRLAGLAPLLGIETPALRLSSARTRWGSCNHRGDISLNWRLIFMPLPVIDYVVAHELAHTREMNHGPQFWSIVAQLCPAWRERRRELRQLAGQIPQL